MYIGKITGMNGIIRRARGAMRSHERGCARGLKQGGLFLQAESQKVCPVLTGNLKGSADTRNIGGEGFKTDIVVNYGKEAGYAVHVHERVDLRHKEGKQAKFLEQPARQKRKDILKIVRDETKAG